MLKSGNKTIEPRRHEDGPEIPGLVGAGDGLRFNPESGDQYLPPANWAVSFWLWRSEVKLRRVIRGESSGHHR